MRAVRAQTKPASTEIAVPINPVTSPNGVSRPGGSPISISPSQPGQTIVMNTTDIQTSITQSAQKVGSAVVTVVLNVLGRIFWR